MSVWRAIKMLLTLRCEESTHLLSDSCHRKLTRVERWSVRLHQIGCSYCRKVAEQLQMVDQAARTRGAAWQEMPNEVRQRIAATLIDKDKSADS
ncbi:MAG: hypothetical protein AAGF31_13085 [Planctomycetota bacterium]